MDKNKDETLLSEDDDTEELTPVPKEATVDKLITNDDLTAKEMLTIIQMENDERFQRQLQQVLKSSQDDF